MKAAIFVGRFLSILCVVPNLGALPPKTGSPHPAKAKWTLDEERLLIASKSSYEAAMAILDQAKKKGTFDNGLRLVSVEDHNIVLNVAWFIVAIGEHATPGIAVETLLKAVERDMGEILIPPWICSPDAYQKNIDALALKHARSGIPYPEPEFRTLANVAAETRVRIQERDRARSVKPPR
jgi:hypothetical protein